MSYSEANLNEEGCASELNRCIKKKVPNELYPIFRSNETNFAKIVSDESYFLKTDWKTNLIQWYLYKPQDDDPISHVFKTNSFLDLANQVDSYLSTQCPKLIRNLENEYDRQKSMYSDLSIPCSNFISSYQSIESMINNFFFCIYAACQIILPIINQKIDKSNSNDLLGQFYDNFEQQICVHPSTVKKFFDKKSPPDPNDILYMNNEVTFGQTLKNIDFYRDKINISLNTIKDGLLIYINHCNNLFYILLCRWFEIFMKSLLSIPSDNFVNEELAVFLNDPTKNLNSQLCESIKKGPIFKILSDTSKMLSFIISKIVECFQNNVKILNSYLKKDGRSNFTEMTDSIENAINGLLFYNDGTQAYHSDEDFIFSPEIRQILSSDPILYKENVANIIQSTLSALNFL